MDLNRPRWLNFWLWLVFVAKGEAQDVWNQFVTSPHYANSRMISSLAVVSAPKFISKALPISSARWNCGSACAGKEACQAFNLYQSNVAYICELLADHLCFNRGHIAFSSWPGGEVWDKVGPGKNQSCFAMKFGSTTKVPCDNMRPGCLGIWPHCYNCTRSCMDCYKRFNIGGTNYFYYWPDGDGDYSVPVYSPCYQFKTFLILRRANTTTGQILEDFRMPFQDMHRILNIYSEMQFLLRASQSYTAVYNNAYIESNGTLRNLTLSRVSSNFYDIFNLNGKALPPTPFVTVSDNRYGCGSLWLLDPNNATYCPGGSFVMLGTPRLAGTTVLSTGISCASAPSGALFYFASLELQ